ncbi:MAG: porin [Myxococcales bacterium]
MVVRRHWAVALSTVGLSLGVSAPVFAQAAPPASPAVPPAPPIVAPPPAPVVPAPAPVAPAPVPVAPAPVAPAPVAPAAAPEEPLPPPHAALPELPPSNVQLAPHDVEPVPAQPEEEWYESFDVRVFADAYFGWNYNSPKPQTSGNGVIRAFDTANGFALGWAGLDISHAAEPIGGTLSLRFGPSAQRYNSSCLSGKCDADYGLQNVKQAFASWRPAAPITLDFGKFDTIYGAEVADSQDNMNYTRGVLYWLGQPAFHTGLRLNAELSDNLSLRALIVNGWNNTIDNNTGKTFGLQVTGHAPRGDAHEWISASLGYLGGPERDDTFAVSCAAGQVFNSASTSGCSPGTGGTTTGTIDRPTSNTKGWRHFIDLLITSDPIDSLHLALNADLGVENVRDDEDPTQFASQSWLGAMLGARYLVSSKFALAGRGEVYKDKHGITTGSVNGLPIHDVVISTATLTVDFMPTKNLMLRLDNRWDHATKEIFPKGVRDLKGDLVTSTLGVVVTTN